MALVRRGLVIGFGATGANALLALASTTLVASDISPWPRVLGVLFFSSLLWPVALALLTHVAGTRAGLAAGVLVVSLTAVQQAGAGRLPLPLVVGWSVSLAAPGDAIRRELPLPPTGTPAWEGAWRSAARVAVAVCTPGPVPPDARLVVTVNGGTPQSLATLDRIGPPDGAGWYNLPVTRAEVERQAPLVVEVRREGAAGAAARVCGGQDDPTRAGRGVSHRWLGGVWTPHPLTDLPVPPIDGHPAPSRYYVELRFYDANGRPRAGIWY